jgi:hypothetical protein
MQPVFFIALFSLIFLMFSSMTAGLSKNIMQNNIERIEETKERFAQIELALNVIAFKQKNNDGLGTQSVVDLSNSDYRDLGGSFLSAHTNFTKHELENDPWNKKVHLLETTSREAIWGASGGQIAEAPITTFMLISAGPNNVYDISQNLKGNQNVATLTATDIKNTDITDESVVGDDIIVRFNNYDAMLDIWLKAEELDNTVKNVALDYYKSRLDAFSPLIQLAQRDVDRNGLLSDDIFSLTVDTDGDGTPDAIDPGSDYDAFANFGTSTSTFTNEWNVDDTSNANDIYDVLTGQNGHTGFRKKPKTYANEFKLSSDSTESANLNQEFIDKYKVSGSSAEFLFPSFDAVEKTATGGSLPTGDRGLQNLGVTNMGSVDPFEGVDGAIDYDYDYNVPNKVTLVRSVTPSNQYEWKINKKLEIDGLGGI